MAVAYDFAVVCADAIFFERDARITRNEKFMKSDVVKIIREQDALRLDKLPQRAEAPMTPAEKVYAAYPRKVGKTAALKAITLALGKVPSPELLVIVKAYAAATAKWPASERCYIPHPATWFNRGSYADDPKEWDKSTPAREAPADTTKGYTKF